MTNNTQPPPRAFVILLGGFHLVLGILLISVILSIWPDSSSAESLKAKFRLLWWELELNPGQRLVLLVMLVGAAGSFIHSTTSFTGFVGNQRLMMSWAWWYFLRPFIGAILAFGVYIVVRGGLVSVDTSNADQNINLYGLTALSFLAGMFSKVAIDKMEEVFRNLFRTATPDQRENKMADTTPVIKSLDPPNTPSGSGAASLTIKGERFLNGSVVRVNSTPRDTEFISASELKVDLVAQDTAQAGTLTITVVNPLPDRKSSAPKEYEIV